MALNTKFDGELEAAIEKLKQDKVYKRLNYLSSPQDARVQMEGRGEVVILSSNNYLGLSNEPSVIKAGIEGLEKFGAGTGSVRFICGTFTVHRDLEKGIADLVGTEASLSYVSAWNANEGLTATIVEQDDFVVSDALNHASIIDSIRLAKSITKCSTAVYQHSDLDDLRAKLATAKGARRRIIWTDGVFSMEGSIAKLPDILQIAKEHDAIVAVDDSHGTGVLGATGRGTAEHFGVLGEVDVVTSTLGKALGGAAGGFVAGAASLCDMLTQRSRPQLFSNALPPTVAASALGAIRHLEHHPELVRKLRDNTSYFRSSITEAGFKPLSGETPIVPIIVGETATAIKMSDMLLDEG
ncbi:MAG: aminotransferase class I/II-fold pyridoxal phosphate-dependent enzyme, partial [Gemmatimonadaceae bacterium]